MTNCYRRSLAFAESTPQGLPRAKTIVVALLILLAPTAVTATGTTEYTDEVMTITWMSRFPDSAGEQHLEEQFGVNIESNGVWPFHEKEKEDILLATGELPDAFPIGRLDELMAYGTIRPIPIAMIRENMPRYTALMDERPLGWLLSRNPDNPDEMMRINGFVENANGILIWTSFRADQAESLGMGLPGYQEGKVALDTWGAAYSYDIDLPLSWFEELLVAFRDGDVDGNGRADTIPMSGHERMAWMWAPVLGAFGLHHNFGVGANGVTNYFEDGQTHLQPISERYRDFLRNGAKWYEMGLIDTEFSSLTLQKSWEKIHAGQVGLTFGTSAAYAGNPSIKNRPPTAFVREEDFGTGAEVVVVPPPIGPAGMQGGGNYLTSHDGVGFGGGLFINSSVSDEKLAVILQILDYYKLDPEGRFLGQYGIPDVHFTWQGEPFKSGVTRTPKEEVPSGDWPEDGEFAMYPGISPWNDSQISFRREMAGFYGHYVVDGRGPELQMRTYRWDHFRETEMPTISERYGETLNTMSNEFYLKVITGQADLEGDWDEYVGRWKANGGDEIIAFADQWPIVDEYLQGRITYYPGSLSERTTLISPNRVMIGSHQEPLSGRGFSIAKNGTVVGQDGPLDLATTGIPILNHDGTIVLDRDGVPDRPPQPNDRPTVPSGSPDLLSFAPPDQLPSAASCGPTAVCGPSSGPIKTGETSSSGGSKGSENERSGTVRILYANGLTYAREPATIDLGSPASIYNRLSFPGVVALRYEHGFIKCSGVLVSQTKILTAAHCLCTTGPLYAFFGDTVWYFRAFEPGLRTDLFLDPDVEFFAEEYCEEYGREPQDAMRLGDIALLTLEKNLPDSLAIAILPTDELTLPGEQVVSAYAVGFGETINRSRPGDKSYAALDLEGRSCSREQFEAYGCAEGQELIASRPPADTCFGDSGGPLYIQQHEGGPMKLLAITSRAKEPHQGDPYSCGSGGIYTSLESPDIREWLDKQLDMDSED